jgi:hypothetical protein
MSELTTTNSIRESFSAHFNALSVSFLIVPVVPRRRTAKQVGGGGQRNKLPRPHCPEGGWKAFWDIVFNDPVLLPTVRNHGDFLIATSFDAFDG